MLWRAWRARKLPDPSGIWLVVQYASATGAAGPRPYTVSTLTQQETHNFDNRNLFCFVLVRMRADSVCKQKADYCTSAAIRRCQSDHSVPYCMPLTEQQAACPRAVAMLTARGALLLCTEGSPARSDLVSKEYHAEARQDPNPALAHYEPELLPSHPTPSLLARRPTIVNFSDSAACTDYK
jgi:hypothetical protein